MVELRDDFSKRTAEAEALKAPSLEALYEVAAQDTSPNPIPNPNPDPTPNQVGGPCHAPSCVLSGPALRGAPE